MLRLVILLLGLAAGIHALRAQTFHELRTSGARSASLNLVLLGEGYTAGESQKFLTDATTTLNGILANESWAPFASVINGYAISVVSKESGADDPGTGTVRDTYFNAAFGTSGVDRLLTLGSGGSLKVYQLLGQFVPEYDVVIVLVNSTKYGGSGGAIAVTSLAPEATNILLHELGHSFADLTDEYVDATAAPNYPPGEYRNATQKTARAAVPWAKFVLPETTFPGTTAPNENVVSIFEGAHYRATGFYRPTYNSAMRSLGRPFGPVNIAAFAAAVHQRDLNNAAAKPSVVESPSSTQVAAGAAHTLAAKIEGAGPITYQWAKDGYYLPGATSATLTIASFGAAQAGTYVLEATNAKGTVATSPAVLTLGTGGPLPPVIEGLPETLTVQEGEVITLSAKLSGTGPFTYQWEKDGQPLAGETRATLTLPVADAAHAGTYRVRVTNAVGSALSGGTTITVAPVSLSRIANLSIRAKVAGADPLIVGFWVQGGSAGAEKPLLIRGIGPELAKHGVSGVLPDPLATVYRGPSPMAENDNWLGNRDVAIVEPRVYAFPLSNMMSKDAAMVLPLPEVGGYTVQIKDTQLRTGVALAEIYDASPTFTAATPRLVNVSARTACGTGAEVPIIGFAITGPGVKRVLIRAVGPTLAAVDVPGYLPDPQLELRDASQVLQTNDNWGGGRELSDAIKASYAYPFVGPDSKDAALIAELSSGTYSVVVSGVANTTGVVLVELYELP